MASPQFSLLMRGFIGGAVVTASISYAILQKQKANVSSEAPSAIPDRFPFGKPKDLRQMIDYLGHTVYFDPARKQPLWVGVVYTKDSFKGKALRKHCKFRRDPQIPEEYSAENADYVSSGWSRGHMAAAADFKYSQQAMDDSFYLTNIVPQDIDNNSGFWNRLEMYCRDLTNQYQTVQVITGPLYQTNVADGLKNYVKYEVIGNSRVPVPTHLYKVIVAFDGTNSKPALAVFVVPNEPIPKEQTDLVKFQISRDDLQRLTGFDFLPELSQDTTCDLCTAKGDSCKLKNWKDVEIYFVKKKVEYATSQKDIDVAMAHLEKKNIKLDSNMQRLFENKRLQIKQNEGSTQRDARRA